MLFCLNAAAGTFTRRFFLGALAGALLLTVARLPAAEDAAIAPLAARSLLLDLARAGDALVAVGERGDILRSTDHGKSWTQSPAPTRALLTGVSFPDATHGWAVGHDGVILASPDGGLTWVRQDQGNDLTTIYLDVLFLDAQHGFAAGAYGKFVSTADGGRTWIASKPIDDEVHFNRLAAGPDGTLYLAGEGGLFLQSSDQGRHWTRAEVPYQGSLFGLVPLGPGAVAVSGLRGHVFITTDGGAQWTPVAVEPKVLLMGGIRLRDGRLLFAGTGGNFFLSADAGRTFTAWKPAGFGTSVADLLEAGDGALITVGEAGAVRLALP